MPRHDVTAQSIPEIKRRHHLVGVQASSNTEKMLVDLGFARGKDYVTYSHYKRGITMLFKELFTMLPLTSFVARSNVCREGYSGDDIEPVVRVNSLSRPLWMVFSKGTDPALVEAVRTALEALKIDGTANRLRERYLVDHAERSCGGN